MGRYLPLLLALALLGAGISAAEPPLSPLRPSALHDKVLAAVMRDLHFGLALGQDASRLQILDPLLSLPSGAELRVASVRAGYARGSWLLRMDCSSRRDCLPFHVLLRAPFGSDNVAEAGQDSTPEQMQSGWRGTNSRHRPPLAHSGDRVLLVEERSGLRIKVPAVCLQPGALGDQIRVRNLASKRVLLATVADKSLVRVQ